MDLTVKIIQSSHVKPNSKITKTRKRRRCLLMLEGSPKVDIDLEVAPVWLPCSLSPPLPSSGSPLLIPNIIQGEFWEQEERRDGGEKDHLGDRIRCLPSLFSGVLNKKRDILGLYARVGGYLITRRIGCKITLEIENAAFQSKYRIFGKIKIIVFEGRR